MMNLNNLFVGLLTALVFTLAPTQGNAQYTDPGKYMTEMGGFYQQLEAKQWQYTSAVARGKSAKKVESKRGELLNSILEANRLVRRMPPFDDDASLRDSVSKFLLVKYAVINEDYEKIIDLEAVAEQSYDLMEAYLLAQEEANNKLRETGDKMVAVQTKFAETHNVELTEGEDSETGKKLDLAAEVFEQYNGLFLIYFKCYKQDLYLNDAVAEGDINAMEQNANALISYVREGKQKIANFSNYNGDRTLASATDAILDFYQQTTTEDFPKIRDFYKKKDHFEQVQRAFEAKKESDRTQKDVDQFNGAAQAYNEGVAVYNEVNSKVHEARNQQIENWYNVAQKFLDRNVPK